MLLAAPAPSATVIDSALFRDAFGTPRMREVFSDRALVGRYIEVEVALARAEARCGVSPPLPPHGAKRPRCSSLGVVTH